MEKMSFTPEIETESIEASFLENGEIIFIGGIEFEVVDVDHQHKNGNIKIKNKAGEIKQLHSSNLVERIKKEEDELLAA
jgi:hypothetical protein